MCHINCSPGDLTKSFSVYTSGSVNTFTLITVNGFINGSSVEGAVHKLTDCDYFKLEVTFVTCSRLSWPQQLRCTLGNVGGRF